jgi:di/tricarboxylate transporter
MARTFGESWGRTVHWNRRTRPDSRFRETFGLNALAIHQSQKAYYRQLADRPLEAGDAVLLHGTWEQLHALEDLHRNLIIITPFEDEPGAAVDPTGRPELRIHH